MTKVTRKNNGSANFNILAVSGKRRSQMKTLFLTALAVLMVVALGCDEKDGVINPMSITVGYSPLMNADVDEDIGFDNWIDAPELGVNLRKDGDGDVAYSGLFEVNETLMTLSLNFDDVELGVYKPEWFGVPTCTRLVDGGGNEIHEIAFGSAGSADGGLISNDKVFQLIPDQECIDTPADKKTEVWANAVETASDSPLSGCTWSAQGNNGDVSQKVTPIEISTEDCDSVSYCNDNTVAFELEPGKYTISVVCGTDQKGSDMVDVPAISTPHEIELVVHTELDEGELCSKRATFSFGLNINVRDMSESIGRVKNGACNLSEIDDTARTDAVMTFDSNCSDNMTTGDLYTEPDDPDGGTDGGMGDGDINLSDYEFLNMVLVYSVPFETEYNGTGTLAIDGDNIVIPIVFVPHNVN